MHIRQRRKNNSNEPSKSSKVLESRMFRSNQLELVKNQDELYEALR